MLVLYNVALGRLARAAVVNDVGAALRGHHAEDATRVKHPLVQR
jgi:hypothetical protein